MPEPSSNGHRPDDKRLSTSLRRVVADELAEQRRLARADSGDRLDGLDERQMARAVLNRELDLRAREALRLGEQPLADAERAELVEEVISQVFSPLPGLDRFMARDDVVNIHVQGCREVIVEFLDGTIERHPSPFEVEPTGRGLPGADRPPRGRCRNGVQLLASDPAARAAGRVAALGQRVDRPGTVCHDPPPPPRRP